MDLKIILVAMTMVAMIHCEDCNTELSETSGVIVSGKYGHGINCSWTITAPKGNYVKLEFNKEKFDVISKFMSCSHDYVQVFYDSAIPSPHIQTFCKSFGNKFVPKDAITSTTNVLVIRLISDKFFKNGEGFEAKYTVVDEFGEPIAPEETEGGFDEDDWGEDTTSSSTTTTAPTTTPTASSTTTTASTSATTTLISKIISSTTASTKGGESASKSSTLPSGGDDGISGNAGAMSGAVIGGIVGIVILIFGILLIVAFVHWKRNKNKRINLSVIETPDGKSLINDNKIYKKTNYKKVQQDAETTETFPL
uniref:zinc metalloproteinase nas-34-like isoform X1 n=1 Tax=Styela clava TaxID=7725 RepID=UPI00193A8B8E|nr:zinc metalloproteinase nas-34-like isoform X1 [Styela clava]